MRVRSLNSVEEETCPSPARFSDNPAGWITLLKNVSDAISDISRGDPRREKLNVCN